MKLLVSLLFAFAIQHCAIAQDSLRTIEPASVMIDTAPKHSPRRAALLSTILPGAGQVYNRSYWKVPVIYAGLATLIYLNRDYNSVYRTYQSAYNAYRQPFIDKNQTVPEGLITIDGANYTSSSVMAARDQVRRYRDLSFMGACLVYLLNIVDASVDAYFFEYDMSDNLSLRLDTQPWYVANQYGAVVRCSIQIK